MEDLFSAIAEAAPNAYWIFFTMLLLAGLNIPFSLDLIVISGGVIGSLYVQDHLSRLYLFLLAGCILAGWEAYWLGRILGPRLFTMRPFKNWITPKRVENLKKLHEKFGILLFLIGRFIPGGVRNALFMTSGFCQMPFLKFVLRDGAGCLLSVTALFCLGYFFAENREELFGIFVAYNRLVICLIALLLGTSLLMAIITRRRLRKEGVES